MIPSCKFVETEMVFKDKFYYINACVRDFVDALFAVKSFTMKKILTLNFFNIAFMLLLKTIFKKALLLTILYSSSKHERGDYSILDW